MLRKIATIISFIAIGIIVLSSQAFAATHTFSVYGAIQEQNGTPVPGATVKLIEPEPPGNDSFSCNAPAIQSTITDNKGDFQFINVTTNLSVCGLTISYPDNRDDINPGNYFREVNATGVQYVNITRIEGSDATPPITPSSSIFAIIALGVTGYFKLRKDRQ